ncbi:MAG: hypothetical protein OHK0037_22230 [Elainellaceae cyanobacterium]
MIQSMVIRRLKRWAMGLLVSGLLCSVALLGQTPPAVALIHPYPEGAGQVMVRSLQTLRDESDHAWQTVLFKRMRDGQVVDFRLRLVGYPGAAYLAHARPLGISTGRSESWTAPDAFGTSRLNDDLANNVGEYDFRDTMLRLQTDTPLWLALPLEDGRSLALTIPPFAIREWRKLLDWQG